MSHCFADRGLRSHLSSPSCPGSRKLSRPRHYSYRVDHDLGFAPHVEGNFCTVCGCKTTTIERWAKKGSWVVGIGGRGTGKTDALIYAMKVEKTPSYRRFQASHGTRAAYLAGHQIAADAPVLCSTHFYYFGDHAPTLPPTLSRIIHTTQGCKRISDRDIVRLQKLVLNHYRPGKHGEPNNAC